MSDRYPEHRWILTGGCMAGAVMIAEAVSLVVHAAVPAVPALAPMVVLTVIAGFGLDPAVDRLSARYDRLWERIGGRYR